MRHSVPFGASARADSPDVDAARDDGAHEVRPDLAYVRLTIVNVALFGPPGAGDRGGEPGGVLVDAG